MIAVGKPKGNPPELGVPGKQQQKPSFGKPAPAHEAAESPDVEQSEEYGAKLLGDMISPLTAMGVPEEEAKTTLASIFRAAAACLEAKEEAAEPADVQESDEDEAEYGR